MSACDNEACEVCSSSVCGGHPACQAANIPVATAADGVCRTACTADAGFDLTAPTRCRNHCLLVVVLQSEGDGLHCLSPSKVISVRQCDSQSFEKAERKVQNIDKRHSAMCTWDAVTLNVPFTGPFRNTEEMTSVAIELDAGSAKLQP